MCTCFRWLFLFVYSFKKLLVKMFVVDMNTLCTLRTIFFKNRWHLLSFVIAFSLGYALGRHFVGDNHSVQQDERKLAATNIPMVDNVQMSADFWRIIQLKIDQIAGNVEELGYMSRETCRFDAGDMTASTKR